MGIEPVGFFLVFVRDGEYFLTEAEDADEDVRLMDLAGAAIKPVDLVTRVVDLAVLAGPKLA